MSAALWIVALAMIAVGVVGTVLPALPGVVFVFGGIVLAAWIDDFVRISGFTIGILALLTLAGVAIDYACTVLFARRAGASRQAMIGAALGTAAGVFGGLLGIVLLPLAGAFAGEFLARREWLAAGRVGLSTWLGLLVAAAAKVALVFVMVGIFVLSLLL